MNNVRMKIAAGATILGLGGLAGFAAGSNDGPSASLATTTAAPMKPKVRTEVVRRTKHVRPKHTAASAAPAAATGPPPAPSAPAPVSSAPSPQPVSAVVPASAPAPEPPTTRSSGGGNAAGGGYDDEGEHEVEDDGGEQGDD